MMKMIYRGMSYEYAPNVGRVANHRDNARATQPYRLLYRGTAFAVDPNSPQQRAIILPIVDLFYRGLAYSLNGWRASQESIATPTVLRAEMIAATAKVHRDNLYRNLQHRLQVATEQGNDDLVYQLEQELNQIAHA